MFALATTRFNSDTFNENKNWRLKHNWSGAIYNTPIKTKIPPNQIIFILEMNNDKNKIEGVGLIRPRICHDKYYKIYSDGNYNRYTYKSNYRIDKSSFSAEEQKYIWILEQLIFKGYGHLKRGQGITRVPKSIEYNNKINFIEIFRSLFIKQFRDLKK